MNSLAYRKATLQHASTVGLVIALYDTLLGNLGRAATAIERKDIQGRCAELVHGFKVLQQLESMVNTQQGGQAAINLLRFYSHLRRHMLAAQFKLSPAILYDQIRMLIDIRAAWQQVDARGTHQAQAVTATDDDAEDQKSNMVYPQANMESERISFSCSG